MSSSAAPVLLAIAHGTRDRAGIAVLERLAEAVRAELARQGQSGVGRQGQSGVSVQLCYVDVAAPSLADSLAGLHGPVVAVPLLLATGYHVAIDIPAVVDGYPDQITVTEPIGPDERISRVVQARLDELGTPAPEGIVVVAAGSSDPAARDQLAEVAGHLQAGYRHRVLIGQLTDADPLAGVGPGTVVANYLLAPGFFDSKLRRIAAPRPVSAPIGAHPLVAERIVELYRKGCDQLAIGAGPTGRTQLGAERRDL
ncbi:hypothetical protein M6D93_18570 [Jatrophihabitans telluris]|uniref:Sirohydrochlorin chelatase n=1 Tax=Jatrophihabitans telluris TaxID=2038343 RepID=A0ABY4QZ29_9ACTN|nr:CbiX/SirB N-terminal domain-containing protein [Jatrophihabitans telluris]UQX88266.1 hypothetical protein M6D93_18570 [Jatrophihabitans telluris]